jgi:hypothetical protein
MALTTQQVLEKWAANARGASSAYVAGVRGTTSNPGELAAQAADKYATGCAEAVASSRYQDGCRAVSPAQWKDACEKIGVPRLGTGIDKGKPKMQAFLQEFLPAQSAVTEQVKAMPSNTLEDRLARMVAQARGTAALKRRGRR